MRSRRNQRSRAGTPAGGSRGRTGMMAHAARTARRRALTWSRSTRQAVAAGRSRRAGSSQTTTMCGLSSLCLLTTGLVKTSALRTDPTKALDELVAGNSANSVSHSPAPVCSVARWWPCCLQSGENAVRRPSRIGWMTRRQPGKASPPTAKSRRSKRPAKLRKDSQRQDSLRRGGRRTGQSRPMTVLMRGLLGHWT